MLKAANSVRLVERVGQLSGKRFRESDLMRLI